MKKKQPIKKSSAKKGVRKSPPKKTTKKDIQLGGGEKFAELAQDSTVEVPRKRGRPKKTNAVEGVIYFKDGITTVEEDSDTNKLLSNSPFLKSEPEQVDEERKANLFKEAIDSSNGRLGRFDLKWKEEGNPKSDVEFVENPDGAFLMKQLPPLDYIEPSEEHKKAAEEQGMVAGVDPYAKDHTPTSLDIIKAIIKDVQENGDEPKGSGLLDKIAASIKSEPADKGIGTFHGTFENESFGDVAKRLCQEGVNKDADDFYKIFPEKEVGYDGVKMFMPAWGESFDAYGQFVDAAKFNNPIKAEMGEVAKKRLEAIQKAIDDGNIVGIIHLKKRRSGSDAPYFQEPREMADHELLKRQGQDFSLPEYKMIGKLSKEFLAEQTKPFPVEVTESIKAEHGASDPLVSAQEALYAALGKKLIQVCADKGMTPEAGLDVIKHFSGSTVNADEKQKPQGDQTIQDIKRKKLGF